MYRFYALIVVSSAVALLVGCTEQKGAAPSPPRPELKRVESWLVQQYRTSPPGSGWKVTSVAALGDQVQVMVEIPADQAHAIMRRPADEQFGQVAAAVCPARGAEVWPMLPPGTGIQILPTLSGQVFIEVGCSR